MARPNASSMLPAVVLPVSPEVEVTGTIAESGPSDLGRWTLLGASMLTVMAGATIAPSLPGLTDHFVSIAEPGTDPESIKLSVQLVLTLPGLAIAFTGPIAGLIADKFGRVPLLGAAILLYAVAGSIGPQFDNLTILQASRLLLGMAVAGVMTATTALIADSFSGTARQSFMGMQGAFMNWGGVVFMLLGGGLAELHWMGPFFVYLLALLLLPGVILGLRGCPHVLAKPTDPLIPSHMPWGQLALIYTVGFTMMIGFYVIPTQLPFVMRDVFETPPSAFGFAVGGASLIGGLFAINFRRVRRWLSHSQVLLVNLGMIGLALLLIGLAAQTASVAYLVFGLISLGLGSGLGMANMNEWLSGIVPPHVRGRALGALTMAVFLGSFFSPYVINWQIAQGGMSAGWFTAAGIVWTVCLFAVPLCSILHRRWRRTHQVM